MATYKANENLTYNLPDEGQVFRAVGDDYGQNVYQVKDGKIQTLYEKKALAPYTISSGGQQYFNETGTKWDALPSFNMGDVNQVLQRLGGSFTAGATGYTQGVADNNPNAATITTNTGQLLTPPAPEPQAGAITPTANYTNPNAAMQVPQATPASAAAPIVGGIPGQQTPEQRSATIAATGQQPVPQATQGAIPQGWDAQTYANFKKANPTLEPNAQDTQKMLAAGGQQAPISFNGSVVDLLNSAGVDSSFANRQLLAQQYGIQGYTGTAAQNTELATKYLDAYNSVKGTAAPQSGAEARTALGSLTGGSATTNTSATDPSKAVANYYDNLGSMDPIVSSLYNQINQVLSTPITTQTFTQEYQSLLAQQGIPALQTELMDINTIMNGTEDDIRQEITHAGGFATDSQVQALTTARNKTLLKQATSLQQQIALKQDYVDQVMQFSQADRAQVEKQIDQKLGLTTQLFDLQNKINNAAKDNYQTIVNAVGYQGLANAVQGNPSAQAAAEQSLGLPTGALSNSSFLASDNTKNDGKVYGTATTGYFTYDAITGQINPITSPAPSDSKTPTSTTNSKGQLSNKQFVELSLQRAGLKYDDVLSKIPAGKVGVIDNATGQIGYIDPLEYNTKQYTYL